MNPNGEVHTPPHLVKEIYQHLIPYLEPYSHIDLYEPGIGPGVFHQYYPFHSNTTYYGCDLVYGHHIPPIVHGDFFDQVLGKYDVILGNLPFNQGIVHTPCSKQTKKSKTIWPSMLKRCLEHIKPNGYGAFIVPCIWLKPDKEHVYDALFSRKILYLKTYDSTQSNKLFQYKCQTPICYVIIQNTNQPSINIWDGTQFTPFTRMTPTSCIPTKHIDLFKKTMSYLKDCPRLTPIKVAYTKPIEKTPTGYVSITSITKTINTFHSKEPTPYYGVPKIILANKLKPIPFKDLDGQYGIYGRDIYIFVGEQLDKIYDFLCIPIIQQLIKSFVIRMNFYEKYIFEYLPDPRYSDVEPFLNSLKEETKNLDQEQSLA